MKILVVEDVTDTIEASIIYMQRHAEIRVETDFNAALDALNTTKFNLVILDVRLVDPSYHVRERGGIDLISSIKSEPTSLNFDCDFAMLTGQMASIDNGDLESLHGYRGVFQKIRQSSFLKFFDEFLEHG